MEAILRSAVDTRCELLLEQFARAREVRRRREGTVLRIEVPSTTEDLLVDLDVDVTSRWITVADASSGETLEFRLHLRRGGFLHELEGRAGGRWPGRWRVDPAALEAAARGALLLPSGDAAAAARLAELLGVEVGPDVHVRPPAPPAALARVAEREGVPVPTALGEILSVADGVSAGDFTLLGSEDVFVVTADGRRAWVIALRPAEEDRVLVDQHGVVVHGGSGESTGRSLQAWLRQQLADARQG